MARPRSVVLRPRAVPLALAFALATAPASLGAQAIFAEPAWAQAGTPDKAAQGEAKARLAAGDKAAKAKDWEGALKEYSAANTAVKSAAAQIGVANAHYQLKHLAESYEAYDEALKSYGPTLKAADKKAVDGRLKELGELTGNLSIRVNETGAQVSVDGKVVGTTPVAALMRVTLGGHKVQVTKEGFLPFEQSPSVAANGKSIVDVTLERESSKGHLVVKEKTGQAIRVSVDGVDVGSAPYEGDVDPGNHEVSGKSPTLTAPGQTVEVQKGKKVEVELVATAFVARLEVRTSDNKGNVYVDGKLVGEGSYAGDVAAGPHVLSVVREGFEKFEKSVTLADKQTYAETVTLKQPSTGAAAALAKKSEERTYEGIYGGLQFMGAVMPTGNGSTVEDNCAATGATRCTDSMPLGGGLGGYIGYSFNPVGFELFVAGLADLSRPSAVFDGKSGSQINPLVASPARTEDFFFLKAGGIGALRARASFQTSAIRLSAAAGVGASVKYLRLARDVSTDNGAKGVPYSPEGDTYVSPGVSLDLGLQLRFSETTSFMLGGFAWVESAGRGVQAKPSPEDLRDQVVATVPPQPLATPNYDMASGTQIYIGPYLGFQFGP